MERGSHGLQQTHVEIIDMRGVSEEEGKPSSLCTRLSDVVSGILPPAFYAYGGPAAIAVFQDTLVAKRRWTTDEGFLNLIALGQVLPGPTTTAIVIALGIERAGALGGLTAFLCWSLPNAIIMTAAAVGLHKTPDPTWLSGLAPAGVSIIFLACIQLGAKLVHSTLQLVSFMISVMVVLLVESECTPRVIMVTLPSMLILGGCLMLVEKYVVEWLASSSPSPRRLKGEEEGGFNHHDQPYDHAYRGGEPPPPPSPSQRSISSLAAEALRSEQAELEHASVMDSDLVDRDDFVLRATHSGRVVERNGVPSPGVRGGGKPERSPVSESTPLHPSPPPPVPRLPSSARESDGGGGGRQTLHPLASGLAALILVALTALSIAAQSKPLFTEEPAVLELFCSFFLVGLTGFGGGNVIMPILLSMCVTAGWLSEQQFITGYALVQMLPGPVLTIGAFIGMIYQGLPGAAAGFLGLNLPSLLLVYTVTPIWHRLIDRAPAMRTFLSGVNCVGLGLMLSVGVSLLLKCINTTADAVVALMTGGIVGLLKKSIMIGIVAGFLTGLILTELDWGTDPIGPVCKETNERA